MSTDAIDHGFREMCEAIVEQACTDYLHLKGLGCIVNHVAVKPTRFGNYATKAAIQELIAFIDGKYLGPLLRTAGLTICPRALKKKLFAITPSASVVADS